MLTLRDLPRSGAKGDPSHAGNSGRDPDGVQKQRRAAAMRIPADTTIPELRKLAAGCQACDLWRDATQTVFGEGGENAEIVLIGEQPGNQEDLQGRPFVGPAGGILDRALEQAGIERDA